MLNHNIKAAILLFYFCNCCHPTWLTTWQLSKGGHQKLPLKKLEFWTVFLFLFCFSDFSDVLTLHGLWPLWVQSYHLILFTSCVEKSHVFEQKKCPESNNITQWVTNKYYFLGNILNVPLVLIILGMRQYCNHTVSSTQDLQYVAAVNEVEGKALELQSTHIRAEFLPFNYIVTGENSKCSYSVFWQKRFKLLMVISSVSLHQVCLLRRVFPKWPSFFMSNIP